MKTGTGGTSGAGYLKRMLDSELFPELWKTAHRPVTSHGHRLPCEALLFTCSF